MPSIVAACAGALAAGIAEAWGHDAYRMLVTTGFLAIYILPIAIVASAIVRGLLAAWQPRALAQSLIDPGGAAPRLAAWLAVIYLGAFTLVWAMFQGTWLLASWTAFKPTTLAFLQPIIAVATLGLVIVMSRPVARLFAFLARKLDARLPGRGTVFAPRLVIAATIYMVIATSYILWEVVVLGRLRTVETAIAAAPAAAIAGTVLAHVVWSRLRRARLVAGGVLLLGILLAIAAAVHAASAKPALALAIWADEPLARHTLARAFDVEGIRRDLPVDAFRPVDRDRVHPDIVVVVIAGTRADRTPAYGGGAQMPALRELAERGAVFQRAYAPSSVARRSLPAMLTGVAPHRVQGRVTPWALALDPRHVVLAERMRAAGYETAAFTCCRDEWSAKARTGWSRGIEHLVVVDDPAALARAARSSLEQRREPGRRPVFAWIYLDEPARAFDGGARLALTDDDRRRAYDSALVAADSRLVEILAAFANRAPAEAPITIVTSDLGQGLGERGQRVSVKDLSDAQIRVPLVIAGPGIKQQRVTEAVGLVDLTPTVIDLAGYRPPRTGTAMDGRSFADIATGRRNGESLGVAFAALVDENRSDASRWAIVRGTWKLIDNAGNSYELYDLRADPGERVNMFAQRSQVVAELKVLLNGRVRAGDISPFARADYD